MAKGFIERSSLQDIASAIREKNGTEDTYKPTEMGDAIRAISTGEPEETITLATNISNLGEALTVFDSLKNINDNCTFFVSKKYVDSGIDAIVGDGLVAVVLSKTNASSLGWWRRTGSTNKLYAGTGGYAAYAAKANAGDVFVKKVIL